MDALSPPPEPDASPRPARTKLSAPARWLQALLAPGPLQTDSPQREIRAGLLIIVIFFGGFLGWAAFAPLDAAVVADGVIVVSGNRQTVQHRDGGVISRLAVREGQAVRQGDVLLELGAPELIAQDRALFSQIVDLQARGASLAVETGEAQTMTPPSEWAAFQAEDRAVAEAAFARYRYHAQRPRSEASARIVGYRQRITTIEQQEALAEQELAAMRPLRERGLVPIMRVNALERLAADLRGQRAELRAQIAATQENRTDDFRRIQAELGTLLPRLAGVRAQLERNRMRAPASGVVVGLSVHTVGGVVRPGEPILDIVPENQELLIEAKVRPEDADDISPGLATEVRITAFTGRDLPIIRGEVRHISADRFSDQTTGEGYFLAQIVVPRSELTRIKNTGGQSRQLRAGLPAQVIVPSRKRTALQYLLEPLNQVLWRSFREN